MHLIHHSMCLPLGFCGSYSIFLLISPLLATEIVACDTTLTRTGMCYHQYCFALAAHFLAGTASTSMFFSAITVTIFNVGLDMKAFCFTLSRGLVDGLVLLVRGLVYLAL